MTAARTLWHLTAVGGDIELVVSIPLRTTNPLNGSHRHWSVKARERKQQRQTVGLVVGGHLTMHGITAPCAVTMTRLGPTPGLDFDNLVSSMKATRDGIADALGLDDADPRITWQYEQRREKTWSVEIRIRRTP